MTASTPTSRKPSLEETAPQDDNVSRIEELIALTGSLTTLFEQENRHLTAGETLNFADLQAEKNRLALAYATAIRSLAESRAKAGALDPNLLEILRGLTARFTALANDQRNILQGTQTAHKGLVEAVVTAATERTDDQPSSNETTSKPYGAKGSPTTTLKIGPISVHQQA
ncbi:MAG: hypothetical protein AAFR69_02425 [Pseudomonadota bacterium]